MEIMSFLSSRVLLVFGTTVGIGISTAKAYPVAAALMAVAFLIACYKSYKNILCINVAMGIILPIMFYCRDEIMNWLDNLGLTLPSLSTPSTILSFGSSIFPSTEAALGPLQLWPRKPPT